MSLSQSPVFSNALIPSQNTFGITETEFFIAKCAAVGYSNAWITEKMNYTSEATIRTSLKKIYRKLNICPAPEYKQRNILAFVLFSEGFNQWKQNFQIT